MHLSISFIDPDPDLNHGSTTFTALPSRQFFHACNILDQQHSNLIFSKIINEEFEAYKTQEVLYVLPTSEVAVFAPTDDFQDQNSKAEDVGFDGELAVYYVFRWHISTAIHYINLYDLGDDYLKQTMNKVNFYSNTYYVPTTRLVFP